MNKNIIVQDIISGIGDGGFIDDFKNAILRGDKIFLEEGKLKMTNIINLITVYKSHNGDQENILMTFVM